jgi:hypothetical protein
VVRQPIREELPARSAGGSPDGLKMNCALMKNTELQMLWKLVKAGEERPLSAADLALLVRIRYALQEYEAAVLERATGPLRLPPQGSS